MSPVAFVASQLHYAGKAVHFCVCVCMCESPAPYDPPPCTGNSGADFDPFTLCCLFILDAYL